MTFNSSTLMFLIESNKIAIRRHQSSLVFLQIPAIFCDLLKLVMCDVNTNMNQETSFVK